jgi:hypothetical protein
VHAISVQASHWPMALQLQVLHPSSATLSVPGVHSKHAIVVQADLPSSVHQQPLQSSVQVCPGVQLAEALRQLIVVPQSVFV